MDCYITETDDTYEYKVEDVPPEYRDTLSHFFFSEVENGYQKIYQKSTLMFPHDISILIRNFQEGLPRMIRQFLDVESMKWETVLEETIQILDRYEINWWLAGSAACSARGIAISPHDLDIMTYRSEIGKFEKAFADTTIEPFHHVTDWIVKGFGVAFLGGRVDFAFEPEDASDDYGRLDCGVYASNHLEEIEWNRHSIRVPPIELHIQANAGRNRTERVKLIESYIEQNRSPVDS